MSYARIGKDSAVYVIRDWGGNYECIACRLNPYNDWFRTWRTTSLKVLKRHLKKHENVGQLVPQHTFKRITEELIQENAVFTQEVTE